ncbi:unnamed protein product, partial [Nesidiocoris tenuis]
MNTEGNISASAMDPPIPTVTCVRTAESKDDVIFALSKLLPSGKIYKQILKTFNESDEDLTAKTVPTVPSENLVREDQGRPPQPQPELRLQPCGWQRPVYNWKQLLQDMCKPNCIMK